MKRAYKMTNTLQTNDPNALGSSRVISQYTDHDKLHIYQALEKFRNLQSTIPKSSDGFKAKYANYLQVREAIDGDLERLGLYNE